MKWLRFTWLRSWFAWRFSLRRLVVATVFLGAVVGLNVQKIGPMRLDNAPSFYWGWPFPLARHDLSLEIFEATKGDYRLELAHDNAADYYRLPWTHQTYRLLNWEARRSIWVSRTFYIESGTWVVGGIIDALFALAVVALILFLQIPRRKAPEQVQ